MLPYAHSAAHYAANSQVHFVWMAWPCVVLMYTLRICIDCLLPFFSFAEGSDGPEFSNPTTFLQMRIGDSNTTSNEMKSR